MTRPDKRAARFGDRYRPATHHATGFEWGNAAAPYLEWQNAWLRRIEAALGIK